jgi:hypothetical protein
MQPSRLHSYVFKEVFKKSELTAGVVITFQVMAVSGVSPGNPNAVGPVAKSRQNELW